MEKSEDSQGTEEIKTEVVGKMKCPMCHGTGEVDEEQIVMALEE